MREHLPDEWTRTKLGAVARYINGRAFGPDEWGESGVPIIRIQQMLDPNADCDYFDGYVDPHHRIDDGDLLFSWSATLATIIWRRGPAALNQHLFKVEPFEHVDRQFLYHVLDYVMDDLGGQSHGSTMKHIKKSDLLPFPISLPPLPEQRRIARVLDTVDAAIRQTEAVIAKLKQVKAGLLHDLLTRGLDENGELRDPVRHPEQFKDSLLGRVPKEWEVREIGDLLSRRPQNGYSPREADHFSGNMMLGLSCLTREGFVPAQLKFAPRADPRIDRARLKEGDLLISRSNTRELVGNAGIYRDIGVPCIYPDLMMRLRASTQTTNEFLLVLLQHDGVRRQLIGRSQGTSGSMAKISSATVMQAIAGIPPHHEQNCILDRHNVLASSIRTEQDYRTVLAAIKQGLMQDLLTGRVRVPEEAVEGVEV